MFNPELVDGLGVDVVIALVTTGESVGLLSAFVCEVLLGDAAPKRINSTTVDIPNTTPIFFRDGTVLKRKVKILGMINPITKHTKEMNHKNANSVSIGEASIAQSQ